MPSSQLYFFVASFLAGIYLQSILHPSFAFIGVLGVLLVLFIVVIHTSYHVIPVKTGIQSKSLNAFLCTMLLFFGMIRFCIHDINAEPIFDPYLGKTFRGEGIVIEEPAEKSYYTEVIVEIKEEGKVQKILLHSSQSFYQYGDLVSFQGKLKKPEDFTTDTGRIFPYVEYLRTEGIYYIISTPKINLIAHHKGNAIKEYLFKIKDSFVSEISRIIPYPESALLSGILIAGKGTLGSTLQDKFKNAGLIHVVVLSGYNVTIVAESIIKLLSFLPKNISYGLGAIGIILFSLMAGGTSTIIRAAIMSIIALFGKVSGNTYNALRALAVSAFIMTLIDPFILIYSPSFQLSFLATLGLILFSPIIKSLMQKRLAKFSESAIGEILCSTLAVQIFLIPYFLYSNGSMSLISFPSNLLVLSYLPFLMLIGFIGTIVSFLSLTFSYPIALISFIVLRYILIIVDHSSSFSAFPFVTLHLPNMGANISLGLTFLCYLVYLILVVIYSKHRRISSRIHPS